MLVDENGSAYQAEAPKGKLVNSVGAGDPMVAGFIAGYLTGGDFDQQPALNYKGSMDSPGYSYRWFGGDTTYCIFPHEAMEVGALMPFEGDSFYKASLGEPLSCSIGAMHAQYHT